MQVYLYSDPNIAFESWNYLSPESPGIGGSETAQVEIAWRLARRGHDVVSYAPLPNGTAPDWKRTYWKHSREAGFTEDGLWVLSRCPEVLDHFGPRHPDQPRWLVCQDVYYDTLTPERAEKLDRILALSFIHGKFLQSRFPYAKEKVFLSGNGIRSEAIRAQYKSAPPTRNPARMIWSSSPDRGLETLLRIFSRAKAFVPELELHCFYGWDNIDKIIATEEMGLWKEIKERCEKMLNQPGVCGRSSAAT